MTRLRATAITTAVATAMGFGTLVLAAAPASAATICEQYGSTRVGDYIVQNNRWGTSATQCIETTGSGFRITRQDGVGSTSGAPVSYPSIFLGCHYTNCSSGMPSPRQISGIGSIPTSIGYTFVSGATYNASFDIWLDSTPKTNGVNQTEIMIWFNRQGSIQPIGSPVGNANVAGRDWTVWQGNNGGNDVVSYVSSSPISSWSFDTLAFIRDTISRGRATNSWYLTSIQAGFEPWIGGGPRRQLLRLRQRRRGGVAVAATPPPGHDHHHQQWWRGGGGGGGGGTARPRTPSEAPGAAASSAT